MACAISDMANEHYGFWRLCAVARRCWSGAVESIKAAIVSDIAAYIGLQTIYDDITLAVRNQQWKNASCV